MKKYPCQKNKIRKNCFDELWTYLELFQKNTKIAKPIESF